MNLAVKFNLLKDTQPHYIYKPESYILIAQHIQHNRPDIIIKINNKSKHIF
jgi:hypothetical protein